MTNETYLGDGVYAGLEGGMIKLWTDRLDEGGRHYIYLDAITTNMLFNWAKRDLVIDAVSLTITGREG